MHTVELLEQAVALAERAGYRVRQEWMGGAGGGSCEIKGRKWLFLDLALGPADQIDQVVEALRGDSVVLSMPMPEPLRELLQMRKSA